MQNNEVGPLTYTIHRVNSKWIMGMRAKCKSLNYKTLRRVTLGLAVVLQIHAKSTNNKRKNRYMGLYKR